MAKRRRQRPSPAPQQDVRRIIAEELSKALALPAGAQATQYSTDYLQQLQRYRPPAVDSALARDPYNNGNFGPGSPLIPAALDPGLGPTGRPAPRRWEYPVSWNLQTTSNRAVPWTVLRDSADQVSIMRSCIEVVKSSLTGLDWSFGIDATRARHMAQRDGSSPHTVEADLSDKYADDTERLHSFWVRPDRINRWTFSEWLGALLEDQLVLDAISVYPHLTLSGDLHSLEILDSTCYSDDTEVLTRRGWKKFADVDISLDEFATRNPKTKAFEWQNATYHHRAPFTGELCHFRSRSLDLLVTPNHRMVVEGLPRALGGSRHRERGEAIVTAAELTELGVGSHGRRIPVTSQWEAPDLARFELAANGRTTSKPFACSGDDFAAFMGMYLSEGSASNGDQVAITQKSTSKGFEPFRELLERIFDRKVCHTGANFVIGRKVLHDYLAQFGKAHEKYVPEIVKGMSARQLGIFWRFYMLGDGHYGVTETIATVSPRMADDLQEVTQKMGLSASIRSDQCVVDTVFADGRVIKAANKRRKYTVALSRTEYRTWKASSEPYSGEVFCVSVPNEVLYVRRNGKAAWCGNTIKPLLDYRGATPQPPYPAFQQILWGFPRGEMTQSEPPHVDAEFVSAVYGRESGEVAPSDALIYKVRNRRSRSPYGFSCVEQALTDVDLWLRRYDWLRSEYQTGSTPEMIVKVDANMTPEQLRQYEAVFNDDLSGNNKERHRARFLPAGFDPEYPTPIDAKFSSDFDLHIIRLICAAFDVLPTSLGFTPNHGMGGMGGSGHQQGEQQSQLHRATKPMALWVTDLINEICTNYLDMPIEVTFRFHDIDPEDEQAEAELLKEYVQSGLQTLNEGRDQRRLPRYDFPEASQPMVVTPTGPVWLNVTAQPTVVPGNLPNQGNPPGANAQAPQTAVNAPRVAAGEESASKSATHRQRKRS